MMNEHKRNVNTDNVRIVEQDSGLKESASFLKYMLSFTFSPISSPKNNSIYKSRARKTVPEFYIDNVESRLHSNHSEMTFPITIPTTTCVKLGEKNNSYPKRDESKDSSAHANIGIADKYIAILGLNLTNSKTSKDNTDDAHIRHSSKDNQILFPFTFSVYHSLKLNSKGAEAASVEKVDNNPYSKFQRFKDNLLTLQTLVPSNLIRIFYQCNSYDMMKNGKDKVTLLSSFPSKNEQLSKESFSLDTVNDIPLKFPNAKINNYEEKISQSKVPYKNFHSLDFSFVSLSAFLERQNSPRMLGPFSRSRESLEVPLTLVSSNRINKTVLPHCSDKLANKDYEASNASDFHKGGLLDLINFVYRNFNSTFEYNEAIKTGSEVVSIIDAEVESPSSVAFTLSSPESFVSFPNDRLSSSLFPCLKTSEARICYVSKQLLELNLLSRPFLSFTPLHRLDEIALLSINDDIKIKSAEPEKSFEKEEAVDASVADMYISNGDNEQNYLCPFETIIMLPQRKLATDEAIVSMVDPSIKQPLSEVVILNPTATIKDEKELTANQDQGKSQDEDERTRREEEGRSKKKEEEKRVWKEEEEERVKEEEKEKKRRKKEEEERLKKEEEKRARKEEEERARKEEEEEERARKEEEEKTVRREKKERVRKQEEDERVRRGEEEKVKEKTVKKRRKEEKERLKKIKEKERTRKEEEKTVRKDEKEEEGVRRKGEEMKEKVTKEEKTEKLRQNMETMENEEIGKKRKREKEKENNDERKDAGKEEGEIESLTRNESKEAREEGEREKRGEVHKVSLMGVIEGGKARQGDLPKHEAVSPPPSPSSVPCHVLVLSLKSVSPESIFGFKPSRPLSNPTTSSSIRNAIDKTTSHPPFFSDVSRRADFSCSASTGHPLPPPPCSSRPPSSPRYPPPPLHPPLPPAFSPPPHALSTFLSSTEGVVVVAMNRPNPTLIEAKGDVAERFGLDRDRMTKAEARKKFRISDTGAELSFPATVKPTRAIIASLKQSIRVLSATGGKGRESGGRGREGKEEWGEGKGGRGKDVERDQGAQKGKETARDSGMSHVVGDSRTTTLAIASKRTTLAVRQACDVPRGSGFSCVSPYGPCGNAENETARGVAREDRGALSIYASQPSFTALYIPDTGSNHSEVAGTKKNNDDTTNRTTSRVSSSSAHCLSSPYDALGSKFCSRNRNVACIATPGKSVNKAADELNFGSEKIMLTPKTKPIRSDYRNTEFLNGSMSLDLKSKSQSFGDCTSPNPPTLNNTFMGNHTRVTNHTLIANHTLPSIPIVSPNPLPLTPTSGIVPPATSVTQSPSSTLRPQSEGALFLYRSSIFKEDITPRKLCTHTRGSNDKDEEEEHDDDDDDDNIIWEYNAPQSDKKCKINDDHNKSSKNNTHPSNLIVEVNLSFLDSKGSLNSSTNHDLNPTNESPSRRLLQEGGGISSGKCEWGREKDNGKDRKEEWEGGRGGEKDRHCTSLVKIPSLIRVTHPDDKITYKNHLFEK